MSRLIKYNKINQQELNLLQYTQFFHMTQCMFSGHTGKALNTLILKVHYTLLSLIKFSIKIDLDSSDKISNGLE